MQQINPPATEDLAWVMGPYQEPIARVAPGETIQVSTLDAFGNNIDSPDVDLADIIQLPFVNPCTGPIYVEDAEPGDTLAVTINSISITRDYAVSCLIPEFGGLCATPFTRMLNDPLPANVMLHSLNDTEMVYDPNLNILPIPVTPFYGTIGTSPAVEAISTLSAGFHGGNMDAADVCPGNTVYLPVNVPGALLFVGDGHAAQGDGEICGVAAEVP
ncbi:MAG: acetamidase/formamidase family protein, partial [Dehalococcoidia bacterium]